MNGDGSLLAFGRLDVTVSVLPSFDTTLVAYCLTFPSLPL